MISDKSMKVICFLFDPNTGGPTIRAAAVYERMRERGHIIRMALPVGKGSAAGFLREKGNPVDLLDIKKPVPPSKIRDFALFVLHAPVGLYRTVRYLKHRSPDVIHVNGAFDIIPALAGKFANIPVVWHLNDTVFSERYSLVLGCIVRILATEIVIAAGRVGAHYGIPEGKSTKIFAPVDVEKLPKRSLKGFPRKQAQLTLIGNWNWIKGQELYIDVLDGLIRKELSVKGCMAGKFLESQESYWKPLLKAVKTKKLEKVIQIPGFVRDVKALLQETDILLLTSHSEASPTSVLEAMSIGVPVVAFDVGGVREMLTHDTDPAGGIVVSEKNVSEMQDAVEKLLSDPLMYKQMANAGAEKVRSHYSLQACVEKHIFVYRLALGKKQGISQ